ncbi:MAG: ParB N-terminal domain-containing protein [Anaerolineales bacterium]|nr:ParB N-terminal domain-containing protein [Anaerolineales bacterium]
MSIQIHPSDSNLTPDLRIVPIEWLVEHEFNDDQRTAPLAKRLEAEGSLKNPPVVTPLEDGEVRYVVLDGANRVTALHMMGYPHVLVQVVPYEAPHVILTTWHHVIDGMDPKRLAADLAALEDIEIILTDLQRAQAGLARREYLMYVMRVDGEVFAARPAVPRREFHEQNGLLNALVNTYKEHSSLHRVKTEDLEEVISLYPGMAGLVVFPQYDASEVLELARDGELLPAGLTRHLIQGRALRVNYPLDELKSTAALDEKNDRLKAWLNQKLATREVRFYGETTYLFDE